MTYLLIVVFSIFATYFVVRDRFAADSIEQTNKKHYKIDFQGKRTTLDVETSKIGADTINEIILKQSGKEPVILSGFDGEVKPCSAEQVYGKIPWICLIGDAGVHGQKIVLLDQNLKSIIFEDRSTKVTSLTSDLPRFSVLADEVTADFRNYDADPLKNLIRFHYRIEGGAFRFDRTENLEY